jgi:hypothetical protein
MRTSELGSSRRGRRRNSPTQKGYTAIIEKAGAHLMSDTCSALGRVMPKGTRVAAADSAKQSHYLPAIMGIECWFGTDCRTAWPPRSPGAGAGAWNDDHRAARAKGGRWPRRRRGRSSPATASPAGGGIDPRTGTVIETRHELKGVSFAGKGAGISGREGLLRMV